jgi:hypothetical protein
MTLSKKLLLQNSRYLLQIPEIIIPFMLHKMGATRTFLLALVLAELHARQDHHDGLGAYC